LLFIVRAVKDLRSRGHAMSGSPAAAMLLTALSELCWVLPCLVQCMVSLFNGDGGAWAPIQQSSGCDIMAAYSIFASFSGMSATVAVAGFTYFATVHGPSAVSARTSVAVGAAVLIGSALFALLPALGVGSYWYTGSGFCYLNFYDAPLAIINLLITAPAILAVCVFLGLTLRHGGWPSNVDLILMLVAFLSAWTWWVPASFIGLTGGTFPSWFFPPVGFLAHGQALLNPYIYGVRWRRSALQLAAANENAKIAPESATVPMTVPATTPMEGYNSAPPSPPASESEFGAARHTAVFC